VNRDHVEAPWQHPDLITHLLLLLSLLWAQGLAGQTNLSTPAVSPALPDGPGRELVSGKCAGNLGNPSSVADPLMTNPANNHSDEGFKVDILLVLAHQDDDTAFSGYLSRAIFDEHRQVAAVFITRGDAGTSSDGTERGEALAAVREVEARQALGFLGVSEVWFLHAPNNTRCPACPRVLGPRVDPRTTRPSGTVDATRGDPEHVSRIRGW
jgi:hypothetical protein